MSFDGRVDDSKKDNATDFTNEIPNDLYAEHIYLFSGNSSFRRTIGKSNSSVVYESLYVK
jgi:hypothetical protein